MAELICPSCHSVIGYEDVNVAKDIALCRACKKTFSFASLSSSTEIRSVPLNNPPKWIKITGSYGRDRQLVYKKVSPAALFLIPFIAAWSGGSIGGIYVVPIIKGNFQWFQAIFGLPFLIGTVVLLSVLFYCLFGKVVITIRNGELTLFRGVGPIGWTRRIPCTHNTRVSLELSGASKNRRPLTSIVLRNGDKKEIAFAAFSPEPVKEYIASYIQQNACAAGTGYHTTGNSLPDTGYYN